MKSQPNDAVSQVIGVFLMIALVSILAIIIYGSIYGLTSTVVQPPFIAIESELHDPDGTPYIELRHKGGDTIFLNTTGAEKGKVLDLFVTMQSQRVRAVPLAPMNWGPGESIYMFNTSEGPRLTKDRMIAISSGIGCAPGERSITAVDIASQLLVFMEHISVQGLLPGPVPTPSPIPEAVEYVTHTQTSITFRVNNPDGTPYDGSLPGAASLRERPGNALVDQAVVISANAVWNPNINSNGIATLTYTNRNFAGVGTAVVTPIIIESTDGAKEIRLRILLQLNQNWIQEVEVTG
ncbi:hypothetical protein J2T58_000849 [Methanocalculus alkaliphilus]|uniref:type IV pilin N-terminal domain-containing protein n=1 Tax=Methanocalculus alkaliphilus TaxID=768730 RepID=UPI00209DDBF6|nr:type IV pilin N-terminal domain-containing protein [Methanocalculus alkaliphilus]MCP1715001.1 hypothetical protein [Methanocalculus alkaliphilus]